MQVEGDGQAAIVFGVVNALAEGVSRGEEEAVADATIQLELQPVVPSAGAHHAGGIRDAPETREERAAGVGGARDHRSIDIDAALIVHALVTDVSHIQRQFPG